MDKRRASVLALFTALLGAGTWFFAAGSASAFSPCNDGMGSGDHHAEIDDEVYVGVEAGTYPVGQNQHQYYCFAVSGGEANQSYVRWDLNPSTNPGYTARVTGCFRVGSLGCPVTTLGTTGAYVNPTTSTNAPLGGAAGTGGSLGTGTGTCTYVNGGTPTCPFGATVLGVTVNEADLVLAVTPVTPAPPCTGVNNTCVPAGATVRLFRDTSNPTLSVTTATSTTATTLDVAPTGTCVQVNATC